MIKNWIYTLIALVAVTACGNQVEYEYTDYHSNLTLDNSVHLDATLASAMNALSPGIFTIIKTQYKSGVNYYQFANNHKLASEKPFTAIDVRLQNQLHIGMNNGLIVGYGNLDNPARFYAYDLQCPNCFTPDAYPLRSYELKIDAQGIATCTHCKRTYNLNTGGNIVSGDKGRTLYRYRASTTGPNGLLRVN